MVGSPTETAAIQLLEKIELPIIIKNKALSIVKHVLMQNEKPDFEAYLSELLNLD